VVQDRSRARCRALGRRGHHVGDVRDPDDTRQGNPAEMASMARKAGLIGERFYTPLSMTAKPFL
jgi:hypothetical protein